MRAWLNTMTLFSLLLEVCKSFQACQTRKSVCICLVCMCKTIYKMLKTKEAIYQMLKVKEPIYQMSTIKETIYQMEKN